MHACMHTKHIYNYMYTHLDEQELLDELEEDDELEHDDELLLLELLDDEELDELDEEEL